jgi:tRNA nucleotidyltransferase (CCA-adding enzyme)
VLDEPAIAEVLIGRLPAPLAGLLARAARLAEREGARLWLVGGVVRDLLGVLTPSRDLDLAVEGDALALAAALAAAEGGRVTASHAPFGTATLELPRPDGSPLVLDLARTRVEQYLRPAALPVVMSASIEADLVRRDFSVNAVALELRADAGGLIPGRLLDPFDGRGDLAAGRLRLLHAQSLRDDPTRILRGLRLAARLGLELEQATAAQLADALRAGYLGMLTSERVLAELCLTLEEPRPDAVLRIADTWGVSEQILPTLGWTASLGGRAERLQTRVAEGAELSDTPLLWAGALLYDLGREELAALMRRFPLPAEATALLRQLSTLREVARKLHPGLLNSAVDRLLRPFSPLAVTVLHYAEPGAAALALHYERELRAMRAPLDGDDLRRMGVAPGPLLGRLLAELRAATLDGVVRSRADAETWVRARLGG